MSKTASATKPVVVTGYGVISTCGDATAGMPEMPVERVSGAIIDFKLENYLQSQMEPGTPS